MINKFIINMPKITFKKKDLEAKKLDLEDGEAQQELRSEDSESENETVKSLGVPLGMPETEEFKELVKDFPEISGMTMRRLVELKNRLGGYVGGD